MKATLAFDLPEEEAELRRTLDGPRAFDALEAFREWLRTSRKHCEVPPNLDQIWERFHDILIEKGVEL